MINNIIDVINNNNFVAGVLALTISIIATLLSTIGVYKSKQSLDIRLMKNETDEIDKAIKKIVVSYENISERTKRNDVINMMMDNVGELKEYYVISKQQARKSFSAALFISFGGVIIYILGIGAYVLFGKDVSVISVIAGSVVEVIAGLFFWLYREATKQLGIYHERLGCTEKYLTVIQIIKEMPKEEQTAAFKGLTMAILTDNREIISHEKN